VLGSAAAQTKAAEWFLDNAYLAVRVVRQLREDLPGGFYRRLRSVASGEDAGAPRAYALARDCLAASALQLSPEGIARYVAAYQEHAPLDVAELWALPALLRLAVLEVLVEAVGEVAATAPPFAVAVSTEELRRVGTAERTARSVGALRTLASMRWKAFFRAASVLEARLSDDPAGVYGRMDFETADRYRRAVEEVSRWSGRDEPEVARRALALAREASRANDARRGHVGYWLVDEGRKALEAAVGAVPPTAERLRRAVLRRPGRAYATALVSATLAVLALPAAYLAAVDASALEAALGLSLALAPALAISVSFVNWLTTTVLRPRILPKLRFADGLPREARTAVVVPSLLGSVEDAVQLVGRLEVHYLSNPDPGLRFVLLTDWSDAPTEETPSDREILQRAAAGVRALNERHRAAGFPPFHLLHRPRRWNEAEGCWMGRERKRGKLEDFDRLLADGDGSGFLLHEGDPDRLRDVRYVLTLDADTRLPRGVPERLAGILAHPLNRPVLDATGRVVSGYTVVQPRVEIAPESAARSRFARLCAGDGAIDIYSRAVSDAYQDLFGAGIYVGKGLYDVRAFRQSLEGRVPENALVSHDLFEGAHGRVALATDVVLYESFPHHYLAYSRRLHRWIRGDWQLLPWLRRRAPAADGGRVASRLAPEDRWKVVDNLRRSLLPPMLLAFLAAGWLVLPGSPAVWTLLAALAPAAHLFTDFVGGLARGHRRAALRGRLRGAWRSLREGAGRWFLVLAFLPHEARVSLDALLRALARMATRRRLLEWTTAAHTASAVARHGARALAWGEMAAAPLTALALGAAVAGLAPAALPVGAPLLLLWLVAPELALVLSRRVADDVSQPPTPEQVAALRRLARRTWFFFATFVGPEDQWLPPDNFQEEPGRLVAHRTSPTNVGAMLLSTLGAWDLGYVGTVDLRLRVRATLDTLARVERYRGHVLNWIDTRTLEPLLPRYVSTVDSGNLAGALWTLAQGLVEAADAAPLRPARWRGLLDTLGLLEEATDALRRDGPEDGPLREAVDALRRRFEEGEADPVAGSRALASIHDHDLVHLARTIARVVDEPHRPFDEASLREARVWTDRLRHNVHVLERERALLFPWLDLLDAAPREAAGARDRVAALLPPTTALKDVGVRVEAARAALEDVPHAPGTDGVAAWAAAVREALGVGAGRVAELREELHGLAARANREVDGMDFGLLYDGSRNLFRIGHNVTADRPDPNHYDLLASEARLASLVAIAKGDVPQKHWFFLGRPLARAGGSVALLSWGGTMFEYLMPLLLVRSAPGTLLERSQRAAVEEQRRHAANRGVPWGISESGYAAADPDGCWQYRAFGVPRIGLKRGLGDDLVVAPYASVLALPIAPRAVAENLEAMRELDLFGPYGAREAIDFTPSRVPAGRRAVVVRSYMAHHQGMILASLANHLADDALVRRFRSVPRVRTVDLLLHERVPTEVPPEQPHGAEPAFRAVDEDAPRVPAWTPVQAGAWPDAVALGNGRLTSIVTDSGAGGLRYDDHAVTRWAPGPTLDGAGLWVYVRDEESGAVWSAGRQPTGVRPDDGGVRFEAHVAEFHRRDRGIGVRMEVAVAPGDDVEVRWVTLVNETSRPRRLSVTSCGEVVLAPPADWDRHPAFHRLLLWSEALPGGDGLLFGRRPRAPADRHPVVLHRLVAGSPRVRVVGFETDRERFLGRHGSWRRPRAAAGALSSTASPAPLDTVTALRAAVHLAPGQTERLAFVTVLGPTRAAVIETAARHATLDALAWILPDARMESAREARRLALPPERVPEVHRLLSLVLHPHGPLRPDPAALARDRTGQPGLWRFGISGDLPILLLRIGEGDDGSLLADLLRAHALWRRRGVPIDLVALSRGPSSYDDDVDGRLLRVVRESGAEPWLRRRGGVFLLRTDRSAEEERAVLEAAARVILDTSAGPLERQIAGLDRPSRVLPPFPPTEPAEPARPERLARPEGLLFDNGLGGFTSDGSEYVIHLEPGATTPAPWCNVLANTPDFGTLVTEAGLGFTWSVNAAERRLTPWSNDPVSDPPGEVLYLRDEATAEVWTPTPRPAGQGAPCQVRHRAGATEFRRLDHALEQRVTVFSALDDPVKVVRLRVRNLLDRPRRLTATYYAQWVLGATAETARSSVVPEYDAPSEALLARSAWNPDFGARTAFLVSDRRPHGFTTDRVEFLGREGDLEAPAALHRWGLQGAADPGRDPCAALQVHLDVPPGGEVETHFVLGEGGDRSHAVALARRWRDPAHARHEEGRVRERWDRFLGAVEVKTPDAATDLALNRWFLYQAMAARFLARAGFSQVSGAYGFRDQVQDVLAFLHAEPETARAHLLACARRQFEEGDVLHWWHPPSDRGVRSRCSDDLLWLPYAAAAYVRATGDDAVLDEVVPFLHAEPLRPEEHDRYTRYAEGGESAPLWEHCARAVERGSTAGARGLPLMGDGDWNDGMNRVGDRGRGESVWLAWFLAATLRALAPIAQRRGERERAEAWRARADALARAAEETAWDGGWYRRAFDDEGRALGTHADDECRIDTIAQSWAVLSGAADRTRARAAVHAARRMLAPPADLLPLLWPPFSRTDRDPGYVAAYPPGVRENGGQYNHAAAWLGLAFAALGEGERALEVFRTLNPIVRAATPEGVARYRGEPYALAGDVYTAPPHAGRAGWTWYTGAAGWSWRLGVEGLLGLRLERGALAVDPSIPREWPGFEAVLRRPGGTLRVHVDNASRAGRGVASLALDGEPRPPDRPVPLPTDGREHRLEVRLGDPSAVAVPVPSATDPAAG
jgi:cyclic beta-1,2-glucan synthetase